MTHKAKKTTKEIFLEWARAIIEAAIIALIIKHFLLGAYKIPTSSMEPTLLGSHSSQHRSIIGDHLLVERLTVGIPIRIPFTDNILFRLPRFKKVKRGDIIVFLYPYELKEFVKRVIGLPGEIIQIINKKVYINGKELNEPWLKYGKKHFRDPNVKDITISTRDNLGPLIIPKKGDIIKFVDDKIYINNKVIYNRRLLPIYNEDIDVPDSYAVLYKKAILLNKKVEIVQNKIYKVKYDCYFMMGDNRDESLDSRFWGFLPAYYITGRPLVKYWPPKFLQKTQLK